ncbi:hypothetical protein M405DRAFT_803388 [Rhizopogon salebrosus TDB-379]|nr:hypothetical protein M405DRAFT_803388 [Rhizopogon salebrosus TDB-379]
MDDGQDEDLLNVPIPTTIRVQSAHQEGIELTPMASQSQPEAGSSHLTQIEELPRQSS